MVFLHIWERELKEIFKHSKTRKTLLNDITNKDEIIKLFKRQANLFWGQDDGSRAP